VLPELPAIDDAAAAAARCAKLTDAATPGFKPSSTPRKPSAPARS
jgi:hypothetical protein